MILAKTGNGVGGEMEMAKQMASITVMNLQQGPIPIQGPGVQHSEGLSALEARVRAPGFFVGRVST